MTSYALHNLEKRGVQLRREISSKNRDFQAVLRLKQPDANSALIKWLNSSNKSDIKPTWRNLFFILHLVNLDKLVEEIETHLGRMYVKQLSKDTSSTEQERGSEFDKLMVMEFERFKSHEIVSTNSHNDIVVRTKYFHNAILPKFENTYSLLQCTYTNHDFPMIKSILVEKVDLDSVFTMASLTQLEAVAKIPVLTELKAKNSEFQAVIRVKQPDVSWAINKWLTTSVLSRIKPTWKNLLLVLRLIHLDSIADQIVVYFKTHPLSSIQGREGKGKGSVMGRDFAHII